MTKFITSGFKIALFATLLSLPTFAQQIKRTPFDVTNYVMDVALVPAERKLNATVDVTFTPLEDTRSVSFELNGSLKVDTVTRQDKVITALPVTAPTTAKTAKPVITAVPVNTVTFVQDQSNSSDLGPHVRIE